jgi:hypothetical protein
MIGKANKRMTHEDIKDRLTFFLLNFEDPEMEFETDEPYARYGKLKYRIIMVHLY